MINPFYDPITFGRSFYTITNQSKPNKREGYFFLKEKEKGILPFCSLAVR